MAAMVIPYYNDMNDAYVSFEEKDYKKTYMSLLGHTLNEEQQELYDKNLILYRLQQKLRSYSNYYELGMTADALNALVQATGDVDEQRENAQRYGITEQFDELDNQITSELDDKFGVSRDQAREWLAIRDGQEYTRALYDYVDENSVSGRPGAYDINKQNNANYSNPVIDGEESEFKNTLTAPLPSPEGSVPASGTETVPGNESENFGNESGNSGNESEGPGNSSDTDIPGLLDGMEEDM